MIKNTAILLVTILWSASTFAAERGAIQSALDASGVLLVDVETINANTMACQGTDICLNIQLTGIDKGGQKTKVIVSTEKNNNEKDYKSKVLAEVRVTD